MIYFCDTCYSKDDCDIILKKKKNTISIMPNYLINNVSQTEKVNPRRWIK